MSEMFSSSPVPRGQMQTRKHNKKLGVCQHPAGILARQHLTDILRNAGHITGALTNLLPHSEEEIRCKRIPEEDRELVHKDPCASARTPVLDNAVVNALQNNEHTHREKLLTEVENIVRGQAVILVYIGFLCEDGQRTGDKQLRCQRKLLRFRAPAVS